MAKKAPKKNNDADSALRDVEAAFPSVFFKSCKEKRIAPDKGGHWEIVDV